MIGKRITRLWRQKRPQSERTLRQSLCLLVLLKKQIPSLPLQQAKRCLPPQLSTLSKALPLDLCGSELCTGTFLRSLDFTMAFQL